MNNQKTKLFNLLMSFLLISGIVFLYKYCKNKESNQHIVTERESIHLDSLDGYSRQLAQEGKKLIDLDEYKKADSVLKKGLLIRSGLGLRLDTILARIHYRLGLINYQFSNFSSSITHFQNGLDIQKDIKDSSKIITYSVQLANAKVMWGDEKGANEIIDNTIPFFKQKPFYWYEMLNIKEKILDENKQYDLLFNVNKNIIKILKDSIIQNGLNVSGLDMVREILNTARTLRNLNQAKQSIKYCLEARQLYQKYVKLTNDVSEIHHLANTYLEEGHTNFSFKKYSLALKNYRNSLEILNTPFFLHHAYTAEALQGIGDCFRFQHKYQEALNTYEEALTNLALNGSIQYVANPRQYLAIQLLKLKCVKILRPNEQDKLLQEYQQIEKTIDYIQKNTVSDDSKISLTEQSLTLYEEAISTAVALYQQTGDVVYLDKALNFYERNKAVILREALQENAAKEEAGISKDLLQKERDLKIELAYSQKKILDAANDSLKNVWKHHVFNLQSGIDNFNRELAESNPKYYRLRYESKKSSLTTSKIQQNLDDKTLFLEYFIGEKNIYTFAVSKTGIKVYVTEKPQHFSSDFLAFREAISKANSVDSAYLKQSYALYQLLVEAPLRDLNAAQNIKTLRIVPDAELGYLPFDCLTEQPASGWKNADNPKWLLYKYASSYLYSNTLLANKNKKTQGENIGFGLNYKEQPSFEQLENAPNEVQSFTSLLGGKSFLNAKATLACFLAEAPKAKILHLAMHGIIDEKNPLNSALIFAESAQQDSLFASQIYNMQLQSGLVVLSACNTGYGKIQRGEGVMSLARAFAFAGCPSTAVSLWSIPNKSTSEIMEQFYANIKAGKPKDEALQLAKLHYLEHSTSPQKTIPNLWAASVLIGDTNPLENQYNYWWILLGIAVFIGVLKLFKARN